MGSATRFAIAIAILFLSMVCFFLAFHPNGVALNGQPIGNPKEALEFMFQEFDTASGSSNANAS